MSNVRLNVLVPVFQSVAWSDPFQGELTLASLLFARILGP